jgi:hypothetical protein
MLAVVDSWNTMARRNGLKGVEKMTSERTAMLAVRLEEHGRLALIKGIHLIPLYPFLLGAGEKGWKATLDWFLKPDSFVNLIEGRYEPRPGGKAPAPKGGPTSAKEAEGWNERLAEAGSLMRWQLIDGAWLLKPRNNAGN